jgi:photosystem II stability/assembly factor-like uncharacterized protein
VVDCSSIDTCQALAAEGSAGVTHDSGVSWQAEAFPKGTQPILQDYSLIACPSVFRRWVGGSTEPFEPAEIMTTADGGLSWQAQALPGFVRGLAVSLNALACPEPTSCVVVGDAGLPFPVPYVASTHDAGRSWAASVLPRGIPVLTDVVCPTARRCLAAGYGTPNVGGGEATLLASNDGGRSWRQIALPRALWRLGDIACSSTHSCVVVGNATPESNSPSIAPDDQPGVHVGRSLALVTHDSGRSWTVAPMPTGLVGPINVTCVASGTCWSAGQTAGGANAVVVRSRNGGLSWDQVAVPGPDDVVPRLDCLDAGVCVAATPVGLSVSQDGGIHWTSLQSAPTAPNGEYDTPAAVSCPSPDDCYVTTRFMALAGGGSAAPFPLVLSTTDAGVSWQASSTDNGIDQSSSPISCVSSSRCWVVNGTTILSTVDGGVTWVPELVPTPPGRPGTSSAISCPGLSDCVVVGFGSFGTDVLTTADGGTTWIAHQTPPGVGSLDAVSCASEADCWAVGSASGTPSPPVPAAVIVATTDGGQTWESQTVPPGTKALAAVSCATPRNCVAVGVTNDAGAVEIVSSDDAGSSWVARRAPSGVGSLAAVSCPSDADCVAVGGSSAIYSEDGGSTWAVESLPSNADQLTGISCSTVEDCMAVGVYSILSTTDGGRP